MFYGVIETTATTATMYDYNSKLKVITKWRIIMDDLTKIERKYGCVQEYNRCMEEEAAYRKGTNEMSKKDAGKLYYDLVELDGKKLLYTDYRIDRETVPEGYYCYDIRHSDEDWGEAATLELHVSINHMGVVISTVPFDFENESFICIDGKLNFIGPTMRLDDYMTQFGKEIKA